MLAFLQLSLLQPSPRRFPGNQRLDIPNTLRILVNATITAEEAHTSHTGDALGEPLILVLVGFVNEGLGLVVAVEVVRDEVVVAVVFDGSDESTECTSVTESAFLDLLEDGAEVWVESVRAVVVCVAEILDIFGQVTEEEDVVLSDFTSDFNLHMSARFLVGRGWLDLRWLHHKYQ